VRHLLPVLIVLLSPLAAAAQGYLSEPALAGPAWAELLAEMPSEPALAQVVIGERGIDVQARAKGGGQRVDGWRIVRRDGVLGFGKGDVVSGPRPVIPSGPVRDVSGAFFPAEDVPIAGLDGLMALALEAVTFTEPAQVTGLSLERTVSILPQPAYGEPRWTITLSNGRETATVTAMIDGRLLGADISQTDRGRTRDFLTQSDWPFALAQEGFGTLVGPGDTVREIVVRDSAISVTADSPDFAGQLTDWSWDGGRFTRGLIDTPDTSMHFSGADLPFALAEVNLAALPKVLDAARAAVTEGGVGIVSVRAAKQPKVAEAPAVEWLVTLAGRRPLLGADLEDDWEVRLSTAGAVLGVLPPARLRPAVNYTEGAAFAEAVAALTGRLGGEVRVLEFMARPERAELTGFDPANPGMTLDITYTQKGFDEGNPFPVMMQTEADQFPLSTLSALTAEAVEAMRARAMAEVAMDGAEVYSLRVWSGAPFWRHPQGMPFVDVRVGIPPRHDRSGYVVFLIDGSFVETVK
jgi:hypothetical protein